ncbi:MAG: GyrI-like domain-containing protein [Bacteroidales bacterium]|nr:GyrI-like domain-containing protein [Bacteroidales bacterium]
MKTVVKIFYWLLGIVAVLVIIAFLLPKTYKVERSTFIKSNPLIIYGLTSNFQQWHLWAPWTKETDSTVIFEMTGEAAQVGTSWKWDGEVLGNGEMILSELIPGELVAYDLAFDQGKYKSIGKIVIENQGDSVKVSWLDEGDLGYNPVSRYMGLFMGSMMGPDFEKGLAKLKIVAESRYDWPRIEEITMDRQVALTVRDSAGMNTYAMVLGKAYGEIMGFIKSNRLNVAGPPFTIAVTWDSLTMSSTMDIGIPVEKAEKGRGRVEVQEFPQQKFVVAYYFGAYDQIGRTYNILDQYIKENSKEITGAPWEIYITDPMSEPDTLKWETRVAFPIK